ncbi:hypothetical protein [Phaeodactylibacter xiamenensis]|uniref:hypothetical protein n=1 Tax=Phaeodactylibacter xiamenensis TaxID=1524460 RepID=UPI0024A998F4|nr:hypothetical protein [Phaeodactylibacter xiamenensis]
MKKLATRLLFSSFPPLHFAAQAMWFFTLTDQLIQTEMYRDIDTEPELPDDIFNPDQLQEATWY